MDPEAPKPEEHGKSPADRARTAQERLDALTSKKPERPAGSGQEDAGRKALTERQRREARQTRQSRRSRKPVKGNPFARGLRLAGFEIRRTATYIGRSIVAGLAALGPVFSAAGMGLVWLIEQAERGLKVLRGLVVRLLARTGRLIIAIDRVITPHRALILTGAVAAVMLGISQYKGLGSIEIGQAGYSGIEDLARAPAIDKTTPAGVHTQILVPIAAIAFLAVIVIALGNIQTFARRLARFRRLASMVLVAIGLLTLAVALLVDLPDATDTTEAALAYAGVEARILGGFWLELAAGAALAVSGLALLVEPSPGRAANRQRQDRKQEPSPRGDRERSLERERRNQRRKEDRDAPMPEALNGGSA